jgi:hypothetical protein
VQGRTDGRQLAGRWQGETVACIASGPSLTPEQIEAVRRWGGRVIVANTTFKVALWADALFAMDRKWWREYLGEARATFHGELWTAGIKYPGVQSAPGADLGPIMNSGAGAVLLARWFGAERVILLGYDGKRGPNGEAHHHGDHPKPLSNALSLPRWPSQFERLARRVEGLEVVNCSPGSAISVFPARPLREVLDS